MTEAQLSLTDFEDPFSLIVIPRYYEGRPLYERLQVITLKLASDNGIISSDDLRGYIPKGKNRKVIGAVLGTLKRKGYIEPVGITKTGVPSSHGRAILLYRITAEGKKLLEELTEGWEAEGAGPGSLPGRSPAEVI